MPGTVTCHSEIKPLSKKLLTFTRRTGKVPAVLLYHVFDQGLPPEPSHTEESQGFLLHLSLETLKENPCGFCVLLFPKNNG